MYRLRVMHILNYSVLMSYSMYCAEVWGNLYGAYVHWLVLLESRVVR